MPRTARSSGESRIYHVGTRGNNRSDIYIDEGDRLAFELLLAKVVREHKWTLQAYCLMGHHYHLLVHADLDDLSMGMHLLNGAYAKAFNKRHGRVGHLFSERFWSDTIDREEHLLECTRYIANNPVRSGFCPRPEAWRWGSYRAIAGFEPAPSHLAVNATLLLFGSESGRAAQRFRSFVADR